MTTTPTLRSILTANDFAWRDPQACIVLQAARSSHMGSCWSDETEPDAQLSQPERPYLITPDNPILDVPLKKDKDRPFCRFIAYDAQFIYFLEQYDSCYQK